MKNDIRLRDTMDSLDMAVLAVKIEDKYKVDVFKDSIPETYGELRRRLLIDRYHPLFHKFWVCFSGYGSITCQTSGTTGEPKEVTHPWEFWNQHIRPGSAADIWGLCYDPSHIAGVFVILQAFANNSKIVLLWGHENPGEEIIENRITHLSASSTFYRMLPGTYPDVKRVTIGSMRPLEDLTVKFPAAKIKNIYATTEFGVLGVSEGDWFPIKDNMSIDLTTGELFVDGKPTGDLVLVDNGRYFIRGRAGQFANVAGEKVYFEYVETVLLANNPEISAIKVFAEPNPVSGEILRAKVVGIGDMELDFSGLKKHERPLVYWVSSIETTDNGKIKR